MSSPTFDVDYLIDQLLSVQNSPPQTEVQLDQSLIIELCQRSREVIFILISFFLLTY